jgi:hypothetical protein
MGKTGENGASTRIIWPGRPDMNWFQTAELKEKI